MYTLSLLPTHAYSSLLFHFFTINTPFSFSFFYHPHYISTLFLLFAFAPSFPTFSQGENMSYSHHTMGSGLFLFFLSTISFIFFIYSLTCMECRLLIVARTDFFEFYLLRPVFSSQFHSSVKWGFLLSFVW